MNATGIKNRIIQPPWPWLICIFFMAGCGTPSTPSVTLNASNTAPEIASPSLPKPTSTATPFTTSFEWKWENPLPDGKTLTGIWCLSPTDVFSVGVKGTIKHYDGIAWSEMQSGTTYDLIDVWGSSSDNVIAVGYRYEYGSKIYKPVILHYDGKTWQNMGFETSGYFLQSIWGSSAKDVFVAGGSGSNGVILHFDGNAWSILTEQLAGTVRGIWGTSSSDVFAVSYQYNSSTQQYNSIIYHYDGRVWNEMARTEIARDMRGDILMDIWGTSSTDVYAVGERVYLEDTATHKVITTVMYHYDGARWSATTSVPGQLYSVWGSSSSDIFAVMGMQGDARNILHFDGQKWKVITLDFENYLMGVHGTSASDIFAVGGGGIIYHFTGTEWAQMAGFGATTNTVYAIWGSSSTDVYAVGGRWEYLEQQYHSVMIHYNGETWSNVFSETDKFTRVDGGGSMLMEIWGTSAKDIFYAGRNGRISHYTGTLWIPMRTGTGLWIYGIWGSSASDVFAVGQNGTILHYDGNADGQWTPMDGGTNSILYDVWGSSSSDVYAVGSSYNSSTGQNQPIVLHFNGTLWLPMDTSISIGSFSAVWGSSSSDVFIVGGDYTQGNIILHFDGKTWQKMESHAPAIRVLNGIWGSSSSDVYAVGQPGGIVHFNGTSWNAMDDNESPMLRAVWGSSSSDIFVGGQGMAILHRIL